jgi:aryl-alcohol dehydrogenase (NADP+)
LEAVDGSLKRLDTGYIDLYQIHRWDPETPIEETMETLNDVVRSGKVRYIGASSMATWQFAKAQYTADLNNWTRFVSMQNHYNLVYREEEQEMIPFCIDQGTGIICWSPLARGFLAGNRTRDKGGQTDRSKTDDWAHGAYYLDSDFDVVDAVIDVAKEHDVSPAQIALAWVLSKPYVNAPIIGATKIDHLDEAIASLDIELTESQIEKLEEHYQHHPTAM